MTKLFTKDLPSYMVLPKRLDINIPPAITAVAEAAVGRDTVMRAVANAVLKVLKELKRHTKKNIFCIIFNTTISWLL